MISSRKFPKTISNLILGAVYYRTSMITDKVEGNRGKGAPGVRERSFVNLLYDCPPQGE
jgi:hypothetical protein